MEGSYCRDEVRCHGKASGAGSGWGLRVRFRLFYGLGCRV